MEKIKIIENPSELGAGTRGSSLGIEAMRVAAFKSNSDFFTSFPITNLGRNNEELYQEVDTPRGKHIEGIYNRYKQLSDEINGVIENGEFPFILAGDHSSAGGTIAGLKKAYPEKRLGVIWIDAHADLHSPYTTPSGNIHGMPLSTALNSDNLDHKISDIESKTKEIWNKLKNLNDIAPKIEPEDLVFIGVRDTEDPEDYFISDNKIKNISVEQVRRSSPREISEEVLKYLSECDVLYISFDVDSMDCDLVSYGTGTPVTNGLTDQEAGSLINNLLIDTRVKCFEIVEINPCLDNKQNKMAETALRIAEGAVGILKKRG